MSERADGYYNAVIGQGRRGVDPYASFGFSVMGNRMQPNELAALYMFNGLARKIINIPVEDALRNGFTIVDGDKKLVEDSRLQSIVEDLRIVEKLQLALSWSRLFGGALIVIRAIDGGQLTDELNFNSLKVIEAIEVYEPSKVSTVATYADVDSPDYGKPMIYEVSTQTGSFDVHESRTIRLNGEIVTDDERKSRDGWGGSVMEYTSGEIMNYNISLRNSLMILQRISQGVLRLNGLTSMLSTIDGEQAVRKRLNLIDMARSIDNTIAIDSEDFYEQHNISLSGVRDVINEFQIAISAVSNIPVTRLFGRSPAGQNATGESDMNNYYDFVEGIRNAVVKPILLRLLQLIDVAKDYQVTLPQFYTVEFNPLEQMNEKELADIEKTKADAFKATVDAFSVLSDIGAIDSFDVREALNKQYGFELEEIEK